MGNTAPRRATRHRCGARKWHSPSADSRVAGRPFVYRESNRRF
jgi:hypothetical protein